MGLKFDHMRTMVRSQTLISTKQIWSLSIVKASSLGSLVSLLKQKKGALQLMMRSLILRKHYHTRQYTPISAMESCLEIGNIIRYQGDSTDMARTLTS